MDTLKTGVWKITYISFEDSCHQSIAPIVAAARCLVSAKGRQRLQRIAGRTWDE
ncbi:MAG: hypothetical protein WCL14_09955 [Bacteroidota bacterium]